MSAIWGNISFKETVIDNRVKRLKKCYEEKCRIDRIQEIENGTIYFACGIQYITKEAEGEQLPYYDKEQEVYFTADCILDNREELIEKLSITDVGIPDGDLMFRAYLRWGIESVKHFIGMFSIAIYEGKTGRLYLASDHVDSRCLYYYVNREGVTFSTLLEPIKRLHSDLTINDVFIKDFLVAPTLRPNMTSMDTPLTGVYKMDPGMYLCIEPSGVHKHIYWTPEMGKNHYHCMGAKQWGKQFRSVFIDGVKDAIRTNGNVAIALSSGLDSMSVGTVAASELDKAQKDLFAFTYVPAIETTIEQHANFVIDETEDVLKVCKKYPNIKNQFLMNEGKDCLENLDQMLDILEIPYKAFVNMPNLNELFERSARQQCKVVLTGQYGNSTISYGKIYPIMFDLYCKKRYVKMLFCLNRYCKRVKQSRKQTLKDCIRSFRYVKKQYTKEVSTEQVNQNPFVKQEIIKDYPLKERITASQLELCMHSLAAEKEYHQLLQYAPALAYLGEYETKMGLYHGVILRDPTRTKKILEFCYCLPYHYFAYKGIPRWLIRGNMKEYIPEWLLDQWLRYGVQNSDWMERLKGKWKNYGNKMNQSLDSVTERYQIDREKVQEYMELTDDDIIKTGQDKAIYMAIVYLLSEYINKMNKI